MGHLDGSRGFPRLCIGIFLMFCRRKYFNPYNCFCSIMFLSNVLVGIGNPPGTMDMKAYLLQKFSPIERKQVTPSSKDNH